jgi:hypothetical protein
MTSLLCSSFPAFLIPDSFCDDHHDSIRGPVLLTRRSQHRKEDVWYDEPSGVSGRWQKDDRRTEKSWCQQIRPFKNNANRIRTGIHGVKAHVSFQ